MNLLEETLKRLGIGSYDEMNDLEKKQYDTWLNQMSQDVTINDVRNHIDQMKNAVMTELADEPEFIHSSIIPFFKVSNPKNVLLKARLKNYLLLSAFMGAAEQAREALQKHLEQLKAV